MKFLTLLRPWQNRTEFSLGQPGSCNHHHVNIMLILLHICNKSLKGCSNKQKAVENQVYTFFQYTNLFSSLHKTFYRFLNISNILIHLYELETFRHVSKEAAISEILISQRYLYLFPKEQRSCYNPYVILQARTTEFTEGSTPAPCLRLIKLPIPCKINSRQYQKQLNFSLFNKYLMF